MLKSPILQLNANCILVTVLFHLFVYLFLIILMKFIFLKNDHVNATNSGYIKKISMLRVCRKAGWFLFS